jgi:hypothetical protein
LFGKRIAKIGRVRLFCLARLQETNKMKTKPTDTLLLWEQGVVDRMVMHSFLPGVSQRIAVYMNFGCSEQWSFNTVGFSVDKLTIKIANQS